MYELLTVEKRKPKEVIRPKKLRREGKVPASIYAKGFQSQLIQVSEIKLTKCLERCGAMIEIQVEKSEKHLVSIEDIQRDPLSHRILHVSFHKVKKGEETTVTVSIRMTGNSPGVKDGGILVQSLKEVDVSAPAEKIPESLTCDVSHLKLNETVFLKDIPVPSGVKLKETHLDQPVVSCTPPRKEKPAETAPAEGEVPVVGEAASSDGEAKKDEKSPEGGKSEEKK